MLRAFIQRESLGKLAEKGVLSMRSRLLVSMGALALTVAGLVAGAGPASADQAHCYGWNTHPDLYSGGGVSFKDGTNIRRGPYKDCDILGEGFPSQGINVHCFDTNNNDYSWMYVVDTTTGVAGWVRWDAVNWDGSFIPVCEP
jgi:hypothetical protein